MLREVVTNNWFTIFLVVAVGLVTLSKLIYSQRFSDFLAVIGNSKYLKIYVRDQKFVDGFDAIMFFNLVICVSIFGYLTYSIFVNPAQFNPNHFVKLLIAIGSLVIIKVLIERLIGSLFEIDKIIDSYLFQKTTYKNYTGLLLLPINILLIYTFQPSKLAIFICLGLLALVNFVGFITAFKNHQNLLLSNLFYFILYLCALEIGPYLILYKLLATYKA